MGTSRLNNRDRLYIRIANDGTAIANSALWRKTIPRSQGRWKDITSCVLGCCGTTEPTEDSFLIVTGSSLSQGTVTAISYPGYSWTGSIGNGDFLVIPLGTDIERSITLTFSTVTGSGIDVTGSTISGDGTITVVDDYIAAGAAGQTSVSTTTSTPGTQYLILLEND